jgi:type I restriction enzyme, S subunit
LKAKLRSWETEMDSKWPKVTLAEAGAVVLDCEHKTPAAQEKGIPYLAIPNVQDGRIDIDDVRLISQQDYEEWTRRTVPQAGDILLTRRGRVGDTAPIPSGLKCAIGQNLVLIRSNSPRLEQGYLRWALTGSTYREQVYKHLNVGAVFDSLNVSDIPKFEIPLPPLQTQRQIADILSAFDDKIELNRQMNRTLEQMARALFKSWFIDFDPVHAKRRGEQPAGMDAGTAALFPDRFEQIDGKEVPEGWTWQPFDTDLVLLEGGTPKTTNEEFWGGTFSTGHLALRPHQEQEKAS